jgi:hypothetical protein
VFCEVIWNLEWTEDVSEILLASMDIWYGASVPIGVVGAECSSSVGESGRSTSECRRLTVKRSWDRASNWRISKLLIEFRLDVSMVKGIIYPSEV